MPETRPLAIQFLKRGSLIHIPNFEFPDQPDKQKYALIMEDANKNGNTIIVILGTSKTKLRSKPWVVFVPNGSIAGLPPNDGVFDCNNCHELLKRVVTQKKCKFICYLETSWMNKIDQALEHAYKVPPELIIRMKP